MTSTRTPFLTLAGLALSSAIALPLPAQRQLAGPPDFRLDQVVPGVYAAIEPRALALSPMVHGNTMFVVNDRDVFAVDANRTPAAARRTLELLRGVTSNPVRHLLVTHWHGDHWMGLQAFREAFPEIAVISTDTARREMVPRLVQLLATRPPGTLEAAADRYDSLFHAGVDMAGRPLTPERRAMFELVRSSFRNYYVVEARSIRLVPPEITFDKTMRLHSGQRVIDLLFVGEGDTPGDAVAWLPEERVLATGDLLVHPVPFGGSTVPSQWARSLRALRALDPAHIVPGHGEVLRGTAYLDLVIETVQATVAEVRRQKAAGATLDAIRKTVRMEGHRRRMVPDGDAAVTDRWNDFLGALIANAFAEARP